MGVKAKKLQAARSWLFEAGALCRQLAQKTYTIATKSNRKDLVTTVDREVEAFLRQQITAAYPNDTIVGEEAGGLADFSLAEKAWFLDPIDGTKNFVLQGEDFAMMLAYVEAGQVQFALIYDVLQEKLYEASQGAGVTCQGEALAPVSNVPLAESLVSITPALLFQEKATLKPLLEEAMGYRHYGACALAILKCVRGQLGGYLGSLLAPWDFAPALIFAQEARLSCRQVDGRPVDLTTSQRIILGTPAVLERWLAVTEALAL